MTLHVMIMNGLRSDPLSGAPQFLSVIDRTCEHSSAQVMVYREEKISIELD